MQRLDSQGNTASARTPFSEPRVAVDESVLTTSFEQLDPSEAMVTGRAKRFALLLMALSGGFVIVILLLGWLIFMA
jgi:hypothetical protein